MDKLIKLFSKLLIFGIYGAGIIIAICTIIISSHFLIKVYSECNVFLDYVKVTGASSMFAILLMLAGFSVMELIKVASEILEQYHN